MSLKSVMEFKGPKQRHADSFVEIFLNISEWADN